MSNNNLPTVASEEAALIAEVGACCKGVSPYCVVDCLVEVAMRKRAATESSNAYEAEHQRASAWREEALQCQAKLAEQNKMIRIRDDEISGRKSWLARIEAAAKDVFALRYMACLTLDTAIYKLWLAMDGTPSIYPAVVVPTATVASYEAEVASLKTELARVTTDYDAANRENNELRRTNQIQRDQIDGYMKAIEQLRDEIALKDY